MRPFPFGITVELFRGEIVVDEFGNDQRTDYVKVADVPNCVVSPRSPTELAEDGRQGVVIHMTLHVPAGTVVKAGDRIRIGADYSTPGEFDVVAEPRAYRFPWRNWQTPIPVALRDVNG